MIFIEYFRNISSDPVDFMDMNNIFTFLNLIIRNVRKQKSTSIVLFPTYLFYFNEYFNYKQYYEWN